MPRTKDVTGQTFGFWTVLEKTDLKDKKGMWKYRCRCKCGTEKLVSGRFLRDGQSKSCGCWKTTEHKVNRAFDSKYKVLPNGCWEWMGSRDKDGYPQIGGRGQRAHRVSYDRFNGPIPQGMNVCHHCDNPGCVNPEHLFLGTAMDNTLDKMAKGRHCYGETVGNSKLKESDVIKIRRKAKSGDSHKSIATEYGMSRQAISSAIKGETWAHVEEGL